MLVGLIVACADGMNKLLYVKQFFVKFAEVRFELHVSRSIGPIRTKLQPSDYFF